MSPDGDTRAEESAQSGPARFVIGKATIVIVAEYKTPIPEAKAKGCALFTSTFRTTGPDRFDLRTNLHSRLNPRSRR
jgi:branched-chain amino acid aminotransferase